MIDRARMSELLVSRGAETPDRRTHPRGRRLRDRLLDRATQNPALTERFELQNLVLLLDDDLRETALALVRVEAFLQRSLELIDQGDLSAESLRAVAEDDEVRAQLDALAEAVANVQKRMGVAAGVLR
jgi:hypothetical protein